MSELIAPGVRHSGPLLDEVWDEAAMNDVQREADPAQRLIPVVLCWRVLASVPRLAATALLTGVIGAFP
jgi:anti-sigma factor RsiW